jgi:hypothetical protein
MRWQEPPSAGVIGPVRRAGEIASRYALRIGCVRDSPELPITPLGSTIVRISGGGHKSGFAG